MMVTATKRKQTSDVVHESMRIGGEKVSRDRVIEVFNPYTAEVIATGTEGYCRGHQARIFDRQGL
jgi:aldehyde dehydrogenase (NAD+)